MITQTVTVPNHSPDGMPQRLSETEAAHYLGFSSTTLRKSRVTGLLVGMEAPRHLKMAGRVYYTVLELDAWLSRFTGQRQGVGRG